MVKNGFILRIVWALVNIKQDNGENGFSPGIDTLQDEFTMDILF